MELRHLRYFIAVAEHESIRLAAEKVHITQPAISRQIQDLEAELGFALFHRSPRGLRLTAAGELYLRECKRALEALKTAHQSARMVANGLLGSLKIGFVENAGWQGLVPEVFNRFRTDAAEVRIELAPWNTLVQFEHLAAGELDGGFVYLFGKSPAGLEIMPLLTQDVVLAVPKPWNLPEGNAVDAKSLNARPFVSFPRDVYPQYFDRLLGACSGAGLNMNIVQNASTEAAILSLVSAGIGAAIVNAANCGRPPALVQFLPLRDISVPLPLAFAWRQGDQSPAMRRFLAVLAEVLESFA